MPEQLWFTEILNRLFAGPVTGLLRALHIQPTYPQAPISNAVAMELLVFLLLIVCFLIVRSRLSVESPGGVQHTMEFVHGFIRDQAHEIIGHHSDTYVPYLTALALFILICNLIGLIPGFESPTGVTATVPLGCALVSFAYYNWQGIRHHGPWGYFKHFLGPMPAMAILMFPIEIVSHLARLLSLTVRLWANIFAGDLITLVFFSMIPIGVPIIFNGLHIVVAFLQAYVFMLLTAIYVSGAVAEEH
jgi:F-type H+-transporting ATPase subunit a